MLTGKVGATVTPMRPQTRLRGGAGNWVPARPAANAQETRALPVALQRTTAAPMSQVLGPGSTVDMALAQAHPPEWAAKSFQFSPSSNHFPLEAFLRAGSG